MGKQKGIVAGRLAVPYLWEPSREVVHDDSCNERLAKASWQAAQCVLQQRCLDDVHLVCSFRHTGGVHPVLCIGSAPHSSLRHCDSGLHAEAGFDSCSMH